MLYPIELWVQPIYLSALAQTHSQWQLQTDPQPQLVQKRQAAVFSKNRNAFANVRTDTYFARAEV
jgi:hypothetical protein